MIKIGTEEFELKRGKFNYEFKGIFLEDVYNTFSEAKKEVYESWVWWFTSCSEGIHDELGIVSSNTFGFTLAGTITYKGVEYVFYITRTKNWIYLK